MILTVTPNPALDFTWRVPRLVVGETHRVDAGGSRAGGKGLNVARVLHSTGHAVLAVGTAGGITGDELIADLDAGGIPHRLLPVVAATRRSIAVVDEATGRTTVLNERGGRLARAEVQDFLRLARDAARGCEAVTVSGSLAPGIEPGELAEFIHELVELNIPTLADLSGQALLAAADAGAHVVMPNRDELRATTGLSNPVAGARALLRAGAGAVIVSLGADGMLLLSAAEPDRPLRARPARALRGNATGAGDAAAAAAAIWLASSDPLVGLRYADLEPLARTAVGWSASAVLMPLAGEVSPEREVLAAQAVLDDPEPT